MTEYLEELRSATNLTSVVHLSNGNRSARRVVEGVGANGAAGYAALRASSGKPLNAAQLLRLYQQVRSLSLTPTHPRKRRAGRRSGRRRARSTPTPTPTPTLTLTRTLTLTIALTPEP